MKIKDYLTKDKWLQRNFKRGEAKCLLTHIAYCYPDNEMSTKIVNKVADYIVNNGFNIKATGSNIIVMWNDHYDRKYDEVKDLVDELDI